MRFNILAVVTALVVVTMTAQESVSASDDSIEKAARSASDIFHSDEFQGRVETIREQLKSKMIGDDSEQTGQSDNAREYLSSTERLYIFISSSIPKAALRGYLADLDKIGDPNIAVVMRGFVGGIEKAGSTLDFMKDILFKDEVCDPADGTCELFKTGVNVDPKLFRRYGIEKVPAVVYAKGVTTNHPQISEGIVEADNVGQSYTVYGDASLEYLMERIQKESGSQSLARLIGRLKEGFFDGKR